MHDARVHGDVEEGAHGIMHARISDRCEHGRQQEPAWVHDLQNQDTENISKGSWVFKFTIEPTQSSVYPRIFAVFGLSLVEPAFERRKVPLSCEEVSVEFISSAEADAPDS
jgi:hypothetical protein